MKQYTRQVNGHIRASKEKVPVTCPYRRPWTELGALKAEKSVELFALITHEPKQITRRIDGEEKKEDKQNETANHPFN